MQSPESLEDMHMGRDIRHMSMQSSRSMPNELFLDQVCLMAQPLNSQVPPSKRPELHCYAPAV